jgi:hypothetical protein
MLSFAALSDSYPARLFWSSSGRADASITELAEKFQHDPHGA